MQKSKYLNVVLATAVLVLSILLASRNDPSAMRKKSSSTASEAAQAAIADTAMSPLKRSRWA